MSKIMIPKSVSFSIQWQPMNTEKHTDDSMAGCNETIASLSQARDISEEFIDISLCDSLIDIYDKSGHQLDNSAVAWSKFKREAKMVNDRIRNLCLRNGHRNRSPLPVCIEERKEKTCPHYQE